MWLWCCEGRWLTSTLLPSSGVAKLRGEHWHTGGNHKNARPCLWSSSLRGWSCSGRLVRRVLVDQARGSGSCASLHSLHALRHVTHSRLDSTIHAPDVLTKSANLALVGLGSVLCAAADGLQFPV